MIIRNRCGRGGQEGRVIMLGRGKKTKQVLILLINSYAFFLAEQSPSFNIFWGSSIFEILNKTFCKIKWPYEMIASLILRHFVSETEKHFFNCIFCFNLYCKQFSKFFFQTGTCSEVAGKRTVYPLSLMEIRGQEFISQYDSLLCFILKQY